MPETSEVATVRLLSLVSWIGEHPGVSAHDVAAHFDRSDAQVERDVALLGDVGDSLPGASFELDWDLWETERRLAVRTTLGVDLPPRLTADEAAAVLIGLRAIAPALDRHLRARLPRTALGVAALAHEGSDVAERLTVSAQPRHDGRLDVLQRAMRRGHGVGFTYTDAQGRVTDRDVDPLELHTGPQGWSLRGWCVASAGERTFRLDRVTDLHELDRPARRHRRTPAVPAGASARPTVRVRVSNAARWVLEEVPCTLVREDDRSFTADLEVWDRAWVESLLIDISPHLLAVDPPEFAESLRARARAALAEWRRSAGGSSGPQGGEQR